MVFATMPPYIAIMQFGAMRLSKRWRAN